MDTIKSLPPLYKIFTLSCAFILAIVLSFSGYSYMKEQKKQKAIEQVIEAQKITDTRERINKFIEIEKDMPSDISIALAMEIANYALKEGNFEEAQKYYAHVAQQKDAFAIIGILGEARSLLQRKEAQQVIALLTPYTQGLPDSITSLVLFTLAEAQEEANLIEEAIQTYTKIAALDSTSYGYIQYKITSLKSKK